MKESYQPRAKQFLPYASLRGFDEIVARKRKIKEPRRELGEDAAEELSRMLSSLRGGESISVVYYKVDSYVQTSARLLRVDMLKGELVLDGGRIQISDIFSLDIKADGL
ncbi:MAG: hypothetical protein IJW48_05910 [Clostridia bacterium]|nr:hypothetical protein [Clostridia bacterium]MBQ7363963.1 hypothetical protein [Clostridia bacterium]